MCRLLGRRVNRRWMAVDAGGCSVLGAACRTASATPTSARCTVSNCVTTSAASRHSAAQASCSTTAAATAGGLGQRAAPALAGLVATYATAATAFVCSGMIATLTLTCRMRVPRGVQREHAGPAARGEPHAVGPRNCLPASARDCHAGPSGEPCHV
jgi:hypothetical protein